MESNATLTPDTGRDTSRYTLSVEAASAMFAGAGVPRSPRSIQRYCKHSVLDAIAIETDTNEKYLIDPASVERRILELKQIYHTSSDTSGHDATGRDATRHNATSPDTSRQQEEDRAVKAELEEKLARAENELEDLRLDSKVNRELAKYAERQNRELIAQITEQSRVLGRLETELRLTIEGPRPRAAEPTGGKETVVPVIEPEFRDASAGGDNPVL